MPNELYNEVCVSTMATTIIEAIAMVNMDRQSPFVLDRPTVLHSILNARHND